MEMGVVRDSAHARHSSPFTLTDFYRPVPCRAVPCRAVPCWAELCGTVAITEPGSDQFGSIVGRSHVNFHRTELHQSVLGTVLAPV